MSKATFPPNSMAASIISSPSRPSAMAKNPPPPNSDTVTRNGASRLQKANRNRAAPEVNGTRRLAENARFCSENTPIDTVGTARVKPAVIPCGESSIDSPLPPEDFMNSSSLLTKDS